MRSDGKTVDADGITYYILQCRTWSSQRIELAYSCQIMLNYVCKRYGMGIKRRNRDKTVREYQTGRQQTLHGQTITIREGED